MVDYFARLAFQVPFQIHEANCLPLLSNMKFRDYNQSIPRAITSEKRNINIEYLAIPASCTTIFCLLDKDTSMKWICLLVHGNHLGMLHVSTG